jgi:hypothetical protein
VVATNSSVPIATAGAAELQVLLAAEDIDDFLGGLGRLVVALRSDDTSYRISLRRDHRPMTATSSDARASHVDEIQHGHQKCPSPARRRRRQPFAVPELDATPATCSFTVLRYEVAVLRRPARFVGAQRARPRRVMRPRPDGRHPAFATLQRPRGTARGWSLGRPGGQHVMLFAVLLLVLDVLFLLAMERSKPGWSGRPTTTPASRRVPRTPTAGGPHPVGPHRVEPHLAAALDSRATNAAHSSRAEGTFGHSVRV